MTSTDARNNIGIGLPLREFMDPLQDEPGWDVGLQAPAEWHYAIVSAPLRACCGVFDQLTQLGVALPIAQVGETMMFFVRSGSAAAVLDSPSQATVCAALGVEVADRACANAVKAMTSDPDCCWIVAPIRGSAAVLPTASTVVAAIHAAHKALVQGGHSS